ncbi:MAG: amphi-Trp domain-containing protein [Desulfobacterales bacterium]|jgi:amphi-Trp domain-containing protein|nr:amphi-Trp domain-containing protein [Desulfobacterales bacterium]
MSGDRKFEFDSFQDTTSIQSFLQSLLDGFSKGKIVLSSDNDEIILHPDSLVRFCVKAKKKDGVKNQLGIKISWKEPKIEFKRPDKTIRITS